MTAPEPDAPTPVDLERAILGESPALSGSDIAAAAGVSLPEARRLWRALGFPDAANQNAFTAGDRDALVLVAAAVRDTGLDFETMLRLTRAVGQTMARLADWEVATLSSAIDEFAARDGASPDLMKATVRFVEELSPRFDRLLVYAWRRHLAAAVARLMADAEPEPAQSAGGVRSVGFADLVAFTALSNELDENELGDLVEIFESRCADVVAGQRGRVIKSLGDAVLFVNEDPIRAYDTAEGIIAVIGRDQRMPDVRVGLSTGSVVTRLGDVFGPPVNLAARLTAVARRNRIIVDGATAERLPDDQFEARPLPARPVRGFGLVEPVAVRRH